ncbi:hypothetical protein HYC85_027189 [Camellia sinensis]|uniref:Glycoside hydrolase family 31 N-terminal domain-containing protein n=1 Tax=Camellia sinensis TaxID=4442 RepID=A0A7J7G5Q8_CAMSI|nr:hypothetical protein HYC85_027189 [Camellia sinensis]
MAEFEEMAVTSDVKSGNMVFEPVLEEGVFRFDCIADHRNAAFPSLSFVNPKDRDTPIMTSHNVSSYIPTFECVLGEQIVQIELPIGTSFYGTGEVSGQLERMGKRVFTWNMVAGAYGPGTTSLYQSHPGVLAVLPSRESLGVLADTTRRCEERYPDPKSLVKDLHLTGFKAIWMLDPGIKHEEGYFVYDSGSELMSGFKQLMESLLLAVTKTMPETNLHRGDIELGGCQNHSHYHNVYGMLMARSTYEGMKLSNENNCPFVLTRAGFIGSQRYAATWTGDNLCTWEHLHMSISMVLQLVSGQGIL